MLHHRYICTDGSAKSGIQMYAVKCSLLIIWTCLLVFSVQSGAVLLPQAALEQSMSAIILGKQCHSCVFSVTQPPRWKRVHPSGLSEESLWDCIRTFKELPSNAIKSACEYARQKGEFSDKVNRVPLCACTMATTPPPALCPFMLCLWWGNGCCSAEKDPVCRGDPRVSDSDTSLDFLLHPS